MFEFRTLPDDNAEAVEYDRQIRRELERIRALPDPSDDDVAHCERCIAELERLAEHRPYRIGKLEADVRSGKVHAVPAVEDRSNPGDPSYNPRFAVNRGGNPWQARGGPMSGDSRIRAKQALDILTDASATARERALEVCMADRSDRHANYVLAVSDPAYERAFGKLARDPQNGYREFTGDEQAALTAQIANRALAIGTPSTGGVAVPFTLDASFEVTGAGNINPLRQISRVVTTVTDQWQGVLAGQISASFDPEASEVSDDSPTLDDSPIPVYMARCFIPFSIEASMDIPDLTAELGTLFSDAKANLEADKFTVGSGVAEPTGIVTRLDATTNSKVAVATNNVFAVDSVYRVLEGLPPRHRPNAQWMAALPYLNLMRQFATGTGPQGAFLVDLAAGTPPLLIGRPVHENSFMDLAVGTGTDLAMIIGDFRKFAIVDRVGMTVELIPHLFSSSNSRPTGSRGLFAFWRTGSDVTDADAFRLLTV